VVRIFVAAIADVHQTYAQLGLFVETMGDIKSGPEIDTAAQGANSVIPRDGFANSRSKP
jgi:hypothetical protein